MNITRRRGTIAFFITLGACLVGGLVTLNIGWIIRNQRTFALAILGTLLFVAVIAGVVLNTVFLIREIRRNERQDSFLNAVTHELKTPIASIRLYLETLQRRTTSEEQRQEFYRVMLADSDRLLSTVEQVLKAGQLGQRSRQVDRTLIDIKSLLVDCIAVTIQRHHLPSESIVLESAPGANTLHTQGIAEDLRTAVLNVLDNGVKYSPDGVSIRCSIGLVSDTTIAIKVIDTGVGIPSNQLKRIFHRFYRVPGRTMSRFKGTGLGLFLVRTIARQYGGDATASSPGQGLGTTITVTLPLSNSAAS